MTVKPSQAFVHSTELEHLFALSIVLSILAKSVTAWKTLIHSTLLACLLALTFTLTFLARSMTAGKTVEPSLKAPAVAYGIAELAKLWSARLEMKADT